VANPVNLLWILIIFGFAPGFVLRTIVLCYPRKCPRRRELVAELYAMKRYERPLWVAEQIETALFEGLGLRLAQRRERRRRSKVKIDWKNAVEEANPGITISSLIFMAIGIFLLVVAEYLTGILALLVTLPGAIIAIRAFSAALSERHNRGDAK
jgi:ABC-type uncharacterized transport system permease subunit